jgi:hypothetical protein
MLERQKEERAFKQRAVELEQKYMFDKKMKEYDAYLEGKGSYNAEGAFEPIGASVPSSEYAGLSLKEATDPRTGAKYGQKESDDSLNNRIAQAARTIFNFTDGITYEEAVQQAMRAHGLGGATPEAIPAEAGGGLLQSMQNRIRGMASPESISQAATQRVLPSLAAGAGGPLMKAGIDMVSPALKSMSSPITLPAPRDRVKMQPAANEEELPDPNNYPEGAIIKSDTTGQQYEVINGEWVEL